MNLFVRKIDIGRWVPLEPLLNLSVRDIEADMITDLETEENKLSIFAVDNEAMAIKSVAAFVGTARQLKVARVGYTFIPASILKELKLEVVKSPGKTRDDTVNSWHRDIIELSGNKLNRLARRIYKYCSIKRVIDTEFYSALAEIVDKNNIPLNDIQTKDIREEIRAILTKSTSP